jgi:hypothetical protein
VRDLVQRYLLDGGDEDLKRLLGAPLRPGVRQVERLAQRRGIQVVGVVDEGVHVPQAQRGASDWARSTAAGFRSTPVTWPDSPTSPARTVRAPTGPQPHPMTFHPGPMRQVAN